MSRRYGASGVSDRNAMLSAYGYGYTNLPPSQPLIGASPRTASPFEQPYASTSSSSSSSAAVAATAASTSSRQYPLASANSNPAAAARDDYSEYDRKKYDEEPQIPNVGISSWWGGADRQAEHLEEQNDARLVGLSDRVKMLKDITLSIGSEVQQGTQELGTLGQAMSGASALLGGTMTRMNKMAKRQGGWFWNMMAFLLFVCWLFVFLWWWRR